jgi:hypothetical protein
MTKPGIKRYELSCMVQKGLRAEAALLGISERSLLEKLVLDGLSPEAKVFVGLAKKPASPKKRFIADDPEATRIITEMYGKGSYGEISEAAGWPKSTIAERIKAMIATGELQKV